MDDDPRLHNHVEDGRRFLRDASKQYDLIFGDVYYSYFSVPPHFTTQEFFSLARARLTSGGVFIAKREDKPGERCGVRRRQTGPFDDLESSIEVLDGRVLTGAAGDARRDGDSSQFNRIADEWRLSGRDKRKFCQ